MPSLKQLTCYLKWNDTGVCLNEYHTAYADGYVETYVAVPEIPTSFSIHLTSNGYIAPGLAMFIYMDGEYQCNRNRGNLMIPDGILSRKHTEIDFHVRQKETFLSDGSFWVSGDSRALSHIAPHDAEYIGTIEVVVLRCHPSSKELPATPLAQAKVQTKPQAKAASKSKKQVPTEKITPPVLVDDTSSNDSSIGSPSDKMVGGLFDGPSSIPPRRMDFGGDAVWDESQQSQSHPLQWGIQMTGPNTGVYQPLEQGTSSQSPIEDQQWANRRQSRAHFKQDWTYSSVQRPNSPQTQAPEWKTGGNAIVLTPRIGAHNSAAGSGTRQANVGSEWGTVPGPNAPGTPAVVINVTHGPPQLPGRVEPSARSVVSKVDSWASRKTPYDSGEQNEKQNETGLQIQKNTGNTWQAPTALTRGSNSAQHQYGEKPTSPIGPYIHTWNPSGHSTNNSPNGGNWQVPNHMTHTHDDDGNNAGSKRRDSWDTNPAERNWAAAWNDNNQRQQQQHGEVNHWNNQDGQTPCDCDRAGMNGEERNSPVFQGNDTYIGGGQGNVTRDELKSQTRTSDASNWVLGDRKYAIGKSGETNSKTNHSKIMISPDPKQPDATTGLNLGPWGKATTGPSNTFPAMRMASPDTQIRDESQLPQYYNVSEGWRADPAVNPPTPATGNPISPIMPLPVLPVSHETASSFTPRLENNLVVTTAYRKPYWSTWRQSGPGRNADGSHTGRRNSKSPMGTEEPLYTVPEELARRKSMSHQVQPGGPTAYAHRTSSPKYMDSYERPYAVFIFKYRSKALLEQMLDVTVVEPEKDEKEWLKGLSKDEIIEHFMRAKVTGGSEHDIHATVHRSPPGAWPNSTETAKAAFGVGGLGNTSTLDWDKRGERLTGLQATSNSGNNSTSPNPDVLWGREASKPSCKNVAGPDWAGEGSSIINNKPGGHTVSIGNMDASLGGDAVQKASWSTGDQAEHGKSGSASAAAGGQAGTWAVGGTHGGSNANTSWGGGEAGKGDQQDSQW